MQSSASLQSSPLGAERGANHGKETGIANLTEFQVLPQLIPQEQMNGESSVPVQHGYTNNSTEVLPKKDVAGLKNQFQSLQISSGESSGMDPKLFRANVRSDDNDGDSEDPVKLFVGQVGNAVFVMVFADWQLCCFPNHLMCLSGTNVNSLRSSFLIL